MPAMNSINHAINGLASSFLLNVGLTSAAEKFDAMARANSVVTLRSGSAAQSCIPCAFTAQSCIPCAFTVDKGL